MEMKTAVKEDAMTGLYNHAEYAKYIKQNMGRNFYVAIMDIDHFKTINDTYGHKKGDEVIIRIADILKRLLPGKGKAFRYGGEEFVVALENSTEEEMLDLMDDIRKEIYKQSYDFAPDVHISVSIGVTGYNKKIVSATELFNKADEALYDAKDMGRNRISTRFS